MKFCKILLILGIALFSKAYGQAIAPVFIDSVSVIDDQRVAISWTPILNDPRIDGYIIYRIYKNNLGETKQYDPLFVNSSGAATSSYEYVDQTNELDYPADKSLRFFITAVDRDVNPQQESIFDTTVSKPHQTMHLSQTIDYCNAATVLKWNRYGDANNGWADGVSGYRIYESQNGGAYQLLYTGNNTSYTRRGLRTGVNYEYKIQAVSGNLSKTSTSNRKTTSGTFSIAPDYVYLYNATVLSNNRDISVYWMTGDTADINLTYQVMMSTDSINYYEVFRLDSVPYQKFRSRTIPNLATEKQNHFFKIITSCSCPDTIDTSNVAKVVKLKAEFVDPTTNLITWNDYQGWAVGTGYFELYRVTKDPITNTLNSELLETLFPSERQYIDNDPALALSGDATGYYLKIVEQVNDPFNVQSESFSNYAYIYREIKIIAPHAFVPNGSATNSIFRPRVLSANANSFNMKIFNRWGKMVFETNDEMIGWDGKDKDSKNLCMPGAYVYMIKAVDATGKDLNLVDTIILLD